jgi:hypothetical protein
MAVGVRKEAAWGLQPVTLPHSNLRCLCRLGSCSRAAAVPEEAAGG